MPGWPPRFFGTGEESPGSMEIRCQLTAGGGDPRESATESKPPDRASHQERVKGCGKSAPVLQQCGTHGKPHREQNLIGMVGRMLRHCRQAGFRATIRVGCRRRPATGVPDEWPSSAVRRMDRTRLTGHLVLSFPDRSKAMTVSRHRPDQMRSNHEQQISRARQWIARNTCLLLPACFRGYRTLSDP